MPPKVQNYQVLYKAILTKCMGDYTVTERSDPDAPVEQKKTVQINRICEDTRGNTTITIGTSTIATITTTITVTGTTITR